MELVLKCNSEGRKHFIEFVEDGCEVNSINGVFYLEKDNQRVAELSKNFSDKLLEKGVIEQI